MIEARTAVTAIVIGYIANILFKFVIALAVGGAGLARRCALAFAASVAGLLLGAGVL